MQAPFLSVFMYLGETEEYKEELAMLIEEFLNQRILGFKNKQGIYITPAFPKLLYVLEEDNIHEDSKYWYLTQLAAKCTAKRLVPDYISEKKMLELKGDCYPCMGCVDGQEVITYKYCGKLYVESFERMWNRFSTLYPIKHQYDDINNPNLYIDLDLAQIYDTELGSFTPCYRLIRNVSDKWLDISFTGGRRILCTTDHPFEIIGRGVVFGSNLSIGDKLRANYNQYNEYNYNIDTEYAWTIGVIICDGCYDHGLVTSIGLTGEDEIEERYIRNIKLFFNIDVDTIERYRNEKGNYKDLIARAGEIPGSLKKLSDELKDKFQGVQKICRQIPNEVFEWNYEAKLAFMAGMIDADGYINNSKCSIDSQCKVQIGSTNKELALQQMALAQSLGMPSVLYHNHYNSSNINAIRYRIEFIPTIDLSNYIACNKKTNNMQLKAIEFNNFYPKDNIVEVANIIPIYNRVAFSYDVTTQSEHFEVSGIYSHNCRSFPTPDRFTDNPDVKNNLSKAKNYIEGKHKYYGRFNMGVVTLNLVDLALSSGKDIDKFWELFEERTELCHRALQCRLDKISKITSDAAPILWQYGAMARLEPGESLYDIMHHGYSTISLGYAGLYECVKYMTDESHSHGKGKEFGLKVMEALNDKCKQWKADEDVDYSLYGTPIESTTYKFAKCLQKRFGVIPEITDHTYITNSYHICVREEIDAFEKLSIESEYQALSPGGCISYVETPNMQNNLDAVLSLIKYIYETIVYAELNTKSDYCEVCGYDGEIEIKGEQKKLFWRCPNCGNTDQSKMHVSRRTCGYIGSQFWNQGRTEEIKDRVMHI